MHIRLNIVSKFLITALLLAAPQAFSVDIFIDTEVLSSNDDFESEAGAAILIARDQLRSDLSSGLYDKFNIRMAVVGSDETMPINQTSFSHVDSNIQNQILDNLMEYYTEAFVRSYRATVDSRHNRLIDVGFFRRMGIQLASLRETVPAEQLLSGYAATWAYRTSLRNGPNCWHTAVASTNLYWHNHRYMNYFEFNCQIRNGYRQLDIVHEPLQFGDVISLVDQFNTPVHAFVYLGPDSRDTSKYIVFTKNGYRRGAFLFQDLYTVVNYVYPGNKIEYYRAIKHLADPSAVEDSPCAREYASDLESFLEARGLGEKQIDPIIAAGLKAFNPELLPALQF